MRIKKISRKPGGPKWFRRKAGRLGGLLTKEKKIHIAHITKKKPKERRRFKVLRKLAGGAVTAAAVIYLVPEVRQDVMATVDWMITEWRRGNGNDK